MAIKIGAVLLFVVSSVLLPCYLPIFSSDWCCWARVSGDHSSKCQWIQGLDSCSSWWRRGHVSSHPEGCIAFIEVAWCSQWSLCHSRGCSGLYSWKSLLAWAYFRGGHCLGPAPVEVAILGLVSWMLLSQAFSSRGGLLVLPPKMLLARACSCRVWSLVPALPDSSDSGLLWQRSSLIFLRERYRRHWF